MLLRTSLRRWTLGLKMGTAVVVVVVVVGRIRGLEVAALEQGTKEEEGEGGEPTHRSKIETETDGRTPT